MKKKLFVLSAIFLISLIISYDALASSSQGIFDTIINDYQSNMTSWPKKIRVYSEWLFWTLASISMVFTFGFMLFKKADIGELFAEFIRFILFIGFFWWLLTNGTTISLDLISSFQKIGASISGFGKDLKPTGIVDIGFDTFFSLVEHSSWSIKSFVAIVMSLFLLIMLSLVAFNMLLLLIQFYFLAYAGIFLLGFGGSRWTYEIALNYFKTVIGIGLQIFTMILIVGIGRAIILKYISGIQLTSITIEEITIVATIGLVMYLLTDKLPSFISGIITGASIGQNSGQVSGGAALATAAAALGASAMALKEVTTQLGGATSAGYNAVKEASQMVNSGEDIVSSMMNTPSYSSEETKAKTPGDTPLGKAMGFSSDTAKMVAQTTANLASGAWGATKDSVSNAVSDTVGGKIAEQIKNSGSEQASENSTGTIDSSDNGSGIDPGNFSSDYFAATQNNDTTLDEEAEIAAFRDKNIQ